MKKLTKENILQIISENKKELKKKFKVKNLYLFGSYAKNEQTKDSDIDFIVEFEDDSNPLATLNLGIYLDKILGKETDIGRKEDIEIGFEEYILNDNLVKC